MALAEHDSGKDTSWQDNLKNLASTPTSTPEPAPTPATDVVPDAPAAQPESPSPVAAASPEATPEGNKPPEQPTPASDAPTTSAYQTLVSRYGGDQEKAAAEMLAMESRLAALMKEKKAQPAPDPQPVTPQAAPEPTPVQPVVQPPTVQTAPAPTSDIEQVVTQHVAADSYCLAYVQEFNQLDTQLDALATFKGDHMVGGRIADLNAEIAHLESELRPKPDALKKYGYEPTPLDPISEQNLKLALQQLKMERYEAIEQYKSLEARQNRVTADFNTRRQQYREHFENELKTKAEADSFAAEVETKANAFTAVWNSTRDSIFKSNDVPAELQSDIADVLKLAGLAHVGPIPDTELPVFMEKIVKAELSKLDKHHQLRSKQYAEQKKALNSTARPGPSGAEAVAAPAATTDADWKERLANLASARHARRA